MFYSQFILAKKGPLGTIWIAAHLERKLRKNQVADTDIGVSVDSILFPEVPIALRLSSHLLLGVVRIYSRKVNYLFHDCSEALVKIKQAFRSTAVDLPPEESTAPYHSITLPETFDLDDFELPDFGFSHGNYVDHHISAREQITLQDTMDDMVFSTSQFGLDERFGDGDASQLALDFDEDLFLDKVHSPVHTSVLLGSEDDEHEQVHDPIKVPVSSMELDQHPCGSSGNAEGTEQFPSLGCDVQADLNPLDPVGRDGSAHALGVQSPNPELMKNVPYSVVQEQAPCTPGLTEEAIPANVQKLTSLGTLRRNSLSYAEGSVSEVSDNTKHDIEESEENLGNPIKVNNMETVPPPGHLECSEALTPIDHVSVAVKSLDTGTYDSCRSPNHLPVAATTVESTSSQDAKEISRDCADCSPQCDMTAASAEIDDRICACGHVLRRCNVHCQMAETLALQVGPSEEEQTCMATEVVGTSEEDVLEKKKPHEVATGNTFVEDSAPNCVSSESAELHDREMENTLEKTSETQELHATETPEPNIASQQKIDSTLSADEMLLNSTESGRLDVAQPTELPEGPSDYPLPETLCSAPEMSNVPEDLVATDSCLVDDSIVTGKTNGHSGESVLGKKRSLMDSTPALPDGYPSKMSKPSQSGRNVNFVPDDDDLLASILVGRRTPTFRIKPTPTPAETMSSRRPRAAARSAAQKRKVLLDDTMVLHGDAIRQQLSSTEDIRRVRRKVPCTIPEIWMIEKLASLDEMFSESLLTGVCPLLASVYSKTHCLNGVGASSVIPINTDPVESGDLIKEPIVQKVDGPIRDFTESNCQVQESTVTLGGAEDSLLHSHEEALQGPTENGVTSEAAVQESRDNDPLKTDRLCSGPAESDMVGPPASEGQMQHNVANDLIKNHPVVSVDGISQIDPSDSDKFSSNVARGQQNAGENHSDSCLHMNDQDLVQPADKILGVHDTNLGGSSLVEDAPIKDDVSIKKSNEDKHGPTENGENKVIEKHDLLGEETEEMGANMVELTQKSYLGSDLQLQGLENGIASPSMPTSCPQSEFSVDNGNEFFNSVVPAGTNEGCMLANGHDEYASERTEGDSVVSAENGTMTKLVGFDKNTFEDKDQQDAAFYPSPQAEGQLIPMHIEDGTYHLNGGEPVQDIQHVNEPATEDIFTEKGMDANTVEEFGYGSEANNIEFLNVDDELEPEEEGMDVSTASHDPIEENSGWSIRTRGVAKYLKSLFESIELNSNKIGVATQRTVPLDRLLVGKTRKEASRLFFETLVLNTKDFVHVDQARPFDNIEVGPKLKLMKSEF
ncbi:sister chromatid cohesion 1 protein 4 isoform X2 [Nymphaea colorata]|uniref:sister chromatid cohesion 1 protein 4 isoform X2 n=1 Tax=Nymphaea colorata TaxID=210225 RepID=UPI00129E0969|nr:sister chromatid cohesion 1 protein 4 isoform X2 [Nymphaea colorata]